MAVKNLGAVTAYGIARKNGFTGTEAQWLESLRGPQGERGADGAGSEVDLNNLATVTRQTSRNLFDKNNVTAGYMSATGTVNNNATFVHTDFLPVKAGVKYRIGPKCRFILPYDTDKTPLTDQFLSADWNVVWEAVQDGYIRVSVYAEQVDIVMISEGEEERTYEPYLNTKTLEPGLTLDDTTIADLNKRFYNPLYGKKIATIGDSLTDGGYHTAEHEPGSRFEGGAFSGQQRTWGRIIAERNGMQLQNLAEGGRTLSKQTGANPDSNNMIDHYQSVASDADYITIFLGSNDYVERHMTGTLSLGTIDSTDTSSFYGAWNTILTWLITNRPYAKILIIIPISNESESMEYVEACLEVAKKYGLPYVNPNGDERTQMTCRAVNNNVPTAIKQTRHNALTISSTNNHPNWHAHEMMADSIEGVLRCI